MIPFQLYRIRKKVEHFSTKGKLYTDFHPLYVGFIKKEIGPSETVAPVLRGKPVKEDIDNVRHLQAFAALRMSDTLSALPRHYQFEPHEVEAIKDHSSWSREVNQHLWTGKPGENHQEVLDQIARTSAFTSKHTSPRDLVVHTGVKVSPERYAHHFGEGQPMGFLFKGFASTSLKRPVALKFALADHHESDHSYGANQKQVHPRERKYLLNSPKEGERDAWAAKSDKILNKYGGNVYHYKHILTLDVPKGSHGAYIEHHTATPDEHEFLLHHGAKAIVHPVPEVNHMGKFVQWFGRLAHDGVQPTKYHVD